MNIFHKWRGHNINWGLRGHFLNNHVHTSSQDGVLTEKQFCNTKKQEISFLLRKRFTPIEVINEVLDDFGAFGWLKLTFVKASGFVEGLGFVDFHWVFFWDGSDLVQVLLTGLDEAFNKVDVTLHLKFRYQWNI